MTEGGILSNLWVQLTMACLAGALIYYFVSADVASIKAKSDKKVVPETSPAPSPAPSLATGRRQQKAAKKEESEEAIAAPARPSTNSEKKRALEEDRRKAVEFAKQALPPLRLPSGSASPKTPGAKRGAKPKAVAHEPVASSAAPLYEPGAIVTVAYRSEVGEPIKPGGEAKVTSTTWDQDEKSWLYNVSYYLGGREMNVAEEFLSAESSLTSGGVKRARTPSKKAVQEAVSTKKAKK